MFQTYYKQEENEIAFFSASCRFIMCSNIINATNNTITGTKKTVATNIINAVFLWPVIKASSTFDYISLNGASTF